MGRSRRARLDGCGCDAGRGSVPREGGGGGAREGGGIEWLA